jgi:formylglycine-generating enzyme required for sulfatase activity
LAGAVRTDRRGIEQVWVTADCFRQGSNSPDGWAGLEASAPSWAKRAMAYEVPAHEVCLSAGYWIDRYEVTNAAFQAFVEAGGYDQQALWSAQGWNWKEKIGKALGVPSRCENADQPDHPRACITWYEAEAYAAWRGGTLPTEAQWEYAARGPQALIFPWGNAWDASRANVVGATGTAAVGTYPNGVSWVGAHDMSGNVMEWVSDWFDTKYYKQGVRLDPQGPEKGSKKVEKGGWWGSHPFVARAAYRHYEDPPSYQDHHIGVRIVSVQ